MRVSVVMPTRDRPGHAVRALRSVVASCAEYGRGVEVVVVDDASRVELRRVVEAEFGALVRVVRLPRSRGPGAARNAGVEAAGGDVVLFTDDDVVVHGRWVRELAVYLTDAPRSVGGVGGRVFALGGDVVSRYFEYHRLLDPFRTEDGVVLYLVTCNCAYRRDVLHAVGGFDEDLRRPGGEDPGLSFKVTNAGFQLHLHEPAVVWHDFRPGVRDFMRTCFRYGFGCRLQADRHWRGSPREPGADGPSARSSAAELSERATAPTR